MLHATEPTAQFNLEGSMSYAKRFLRLFIGLFICAFGVTLLYKANLGMNPWGTLDLGLNRVLGITIGFSSQAVGFCIIIASLFLGIRPGPGTLLNMFFIGFFVDFLNRSTKTIVLNGFALQFVVFTIGLLTLNFGIYYYLSSRLGGGPRDGLMIGIVKRFHFKVAPVRIIIEGTALTAGFLLGGKVGIGTVILTLFNGPLLQYLFKRFNFDPKTTEQETLDQVFARIFKRG